MTKMVTTGRSSVHLRKASLLSRQWGPPQTGNYKGIHTVYSGFNEAFRKYFDGANPIEITNQLAKEKKIVIRPVKGGVMLYLPDEVPQSDKAEQVLKKMGLDK